MAKDLGEGPTVDDVDELTLALDEAAQDYSWERQLGPAATEKARLDAAKQAVASALRAARADTESLRRGLKMAMEDHAEAERLLREAKAQLASSREEARKALEILRDMYDEEPCLILNLEGHCENHGWLTSPAEDVTDLSDHGVCPHKRAQDLFATDSITSENGGAPPASVTP